MKARKFLWLLPVLAVVGYVACRKTDRLTTEDPSPQVKESRFFSEHKSSNPQVQGIADYVKRQNDKLGFVEKTTQMIGYPRWDKTLSFKKPGVNKNGKGNYTESEDSASIYYIPFVRDSQNYVNATMVVKTIQNDTTFNYLCDWQYHNRPHGSPYSDSTAEKFALLFMLMDNRTLEHTEFNITDIELFPESVPGPDGRKKLKLTNISTSNNLIETFTYVELCVDFYVCGDVAYCEAHGGCDYLNCAAGPGEPGHCYLVSSVCEGWWEDTGGGGSGGGSGSGSGGTGGTGGGSGGGGTGGGGTPPPCGGAITPTSNLIETNAPCTPGWEPILPDEPPVTEPVDSMLARYSRIFNSTADSIFLLSNTNNEEWGHILVQNSSNNVYPKNCTTSHDPGFVKQNRSISNGETIIGELHTHPDPDPNPLNRSAPSGADLAPLRINSKQNYTVFVDCGNVRYALVIENVSLSRNFFTSNPIDLINYNHSVIAQSHPDAYSNWQNATQVALLQLIGNSSSCGIGFYKSDASKTNFIKLN